MKYLFIKLSLFLLCCFLTVHALNRISNHFMEGQTTLISRHYLFEKNIYDYIKTSDDYTSFVVGSSHAGGIDTNVFLGAEQKLNRAGQDIFEGRYVIESTVPYASDLKRIFVSISFFTFVYDNKVRDDFRTRYYALPAYRPMKIDWHNFIVGKSLQYFPIINLVRKDNWKHVWYGIKTEKGSDWLDYIWTLVATDPLLTSTNTYTISADNFRQGLKEETKLLHNCNPPNFDMSAELSSAIENFNSRVISMSDAHPNITVDTYNELEQMIIFAEANDIEIIFFTPPYYSAYTQIMSSEIPFNVEFIESGSYIDLTESIMNRARKKYNIKYYDFSRDPEFINNPKLFMNASHLNKCGKRLFSIKLREAMREDTN